MSRTFVHYLEPGELAFGKSFVFETYLTVKILAILDRFKTAKPLNAPAASAVKDFSSQLSLAVGRLSLKGLAGLESFAFSRESSRSAQLEANKDLGKTKIEELLKFHSERKSTAKDFFTE